ncbi:MAG: yehU 1 [Lacunisphaera sp.]|nr:yehU 1 [Lacunisphaera sp.]
MSPSSSPSHLPLWRHGRFWLLLWLAGTVALVAILLWDARSWLQAAPQASFRSTKLNLWPLEVLWWLLVPVIIWLQQALALAERRWPWALGLHALAAVLMTGLFIILTAVRMLVVNHLPWAFLPVVAGDLRRTGEWSYTPALVYLLLVFALYALNFYRQWRAGQRLTGELKVANAQLETRLVRASLDALKMQLHPHFLFNTLNSITSLIRNGRTQEAEDIVAGLGELLRRSLDHRQEASDTLEHELEFLHRYLEIESIRFQDRLQVDFDVSPKCLRALVPSLMLQPLVENAMKHGISKDPNARLLRISAERDGTRLILTVYNDGPPLPKDDAALSQGIGVQNTLARLQMLYGDAARLRLRDQPPHGVRAEIILPFQTNTL